MIFNLLFYGVPGGGQGEDTKAALADFLKKILILDIDIRDAPVQVTHRPGQLLESQKKPRTIDVHFVKLKDKDRILKAANKLVGKTLWAK